MFTVGEFAKLAQVSKRLLRYYDEIGLLRPVKIDQQSGYRFYSATQMEPLNRILALKELGMSLDQIRRMLEDDISTEETQGMLLLKKAEVEQALAAEMQRIRMIESRLQSIKAREDGVPLNVVIKQVAAQPVLSARSIFDDFDSAMQLLGQIRMALPEKSGYGMSFLICHDDDAKDHDMDLEMGRLIEAQAHLPVPLSDALTLHVAELPAATMATTVVTGALETIHTGYADIALWIETNGYQVAGTPREITLAYPRKADGSDLVTEIQFPVEPAQA